MKKGILWNKRVVCIVAATAAVLVSAGLVSGEIHKLKEEYSEKVSDIENPGIIRIEEESKDEITSGSKGHNELFNLSENDKDIDAKQAYTKNIDFYLEARGVKLDSPDKLIGNNYASSNFPNQKTVLILNEDGTYTYTYESRGKKEAVNGTYSISNQTIVCEGGFILVDGFKLKVVENTAFYVNALTNNTCVYGSSVKNGALESVLEYQEIIEEKQ